MSKRQNTRSGPWTRRWRDWVRPTRVPGVWLRRDGGYRVRLRRTHPDTGKTVSIVRVIQARSPQQARDTARLLLDRRLASPGVKVKRFGDFALDLLEAKIADGSIVSAAGKYKWGQILKNHLLPEFGPIPVDRLTYARIDEWRRSLAKMTPDSANTKLSILRVIMKKATAVYGLPRDPCAGIENFSKRGHATYSVEAPNSLPVDQVGAFLAKMRELYPHFYAFTALGFATGLRPSHIRPPRHQGPAPDLNWETGELLVRRSHTGGEPMATTKTGKHQSITLPEDLLEVLRWHTETQIPLRFEDSELIFPSRIGGHMSRSALGKPFREVSDALELKARVTPRGMRRTYQDLARAAEIRDVVTRSISGHATDAMQRYYSTVRSDEQREALTKVIRLAQIRAA